MQLLWHAAAGEAEVRCRFEHLHRRGPSGLVIILTKGFVWRSSHTLLDDLKKMKVSVKGNCQVFS